MVGRLHSKVEDYAKEKFPNMFTSCALAEDGGVIVYHKQGSPQFMNAITAAFPDIEIQFKETRFSVSEIEALVQRIRDDLPELESLGAQILVYGPRADGTGAFVAALNVDVTRPIIAERYGDTVAVEASGGLFPG